MIPEWAPTQPYILLLASLNCSNFFAIQNKLSLFANSDWRGLIHVFDWIVSKLKSQHFEITFHGSKKILPISYPSPFPLNFALHHSLSNHCYGEYEEAITL